MLKDTHTDESNFSPSYIHKFTTPEKFIEAKIEMLEKDFLIVLTDEELMNLRSYKKENEINAVVRSIIDSRWR